MGTYINKGNNGFRISRNSEYVDKSGVIAVVNATLDTEYMFSCVSRCRRFGKSMVAKMLAAYYDHSCDSRSLFADLEIAQSPSFEQNLNKFPVIYIDITDFTTRDNLEVTDIVPTLQNEVIADVHAAYPDAVIEAKDDLMAVLTKTAIHYRTKFIMIIDEWDAICREATGAMDSYVNLLRRMFKGSTSLQVFAGVYMTGILPIKKYKTQSALNNFKEYSMVTPGSMARFFGFTKEEVRLLADKYDMDFDELEKWYDGYQIGNEMSMFNPNSVMEAIRNKWCESYWSKTGAYDAISEYIGMNYEGLKDDAIGLLAGEHCVVDPAGFSNDISEVRNRDDVLTVLIHLGYLSYDRCKQECFIPNWEVAKEVENAIKINNWENVVDTLKQSRDLLKATLRGDSDYVAHALRAIHSNETSILSYNDENSLACVISLAYFYARNDYRQEKDMPIWCSSPARK